MCFFLNIFLYRWPFYEVHLTFFFIPLVLFVVEKWQCFKNQIIKRIFLYT